MRRRCKMCYPFSLSLCVCVRVCVCVYQNGWCHSHHPLCSNSNKHPYTTHVVLRGASTTPSSEGCLKSGVQGGVPVVRLRSPHNQNILNLLPGPEALSQPPPPPPAHNCSTRSWHGPCNLAASAHTLLPPVPPLPLLPLARKGEGFRCMSQLHGQPPRHQDASP